MNIEKSIRVGCATKSIKPSELAAMIGIANVTMSKLVAKKNPASPSAKVLQKMAEALGYSVSEFIKLGE